MAGIGMRCYNQSMSSGAGTTWARDVDIRESLRRLMRDLHNDDAVGDAIIVEEMGLCEMQARLDLGVINGRFIGYEIKSPRDNLSRLSGQVEVYSRTLDQVEVVTCEEHLPGVLDLVPDWWGVMIVAPSIVGFEFRVEREARANPGWDPMSLVQLLWRHEALEALAVLGRDRGVRTKPKWYVWERLVSSVSAEELHGIVLGRVKARVGWSTARRLA